MPTEEYKNIEKYINIILEAYGDIKKYADQTKTSDINIVVSYSINEYVVDYIMNWKMENEQRIFVEKTFGHEVILEFLKEKKADFIMFADWFNLAQDVSEKEKIIFKPLFEERTVVCIGPRSPFYYQETLTVEEFFIDGTDNNREQQRRNYFKIMPRGIQQDACKNYWCQ